MGNPFAHIELSTGDVKQAKQFYKKLFDWKLEDMPGGYTMIGIAEAGAIGGMQKNPMPEGPNNWLPYIEVASVKKTLATAEKAGAKVILPFHPIDPMGAIGIVADPQGAVFGIWEKPAKAAKKPAKKAAKKPAKKAAKKKR